MSNFFIFLKFWIFFGGRGGEGLGVEGKCVG
jgi:hypothetical protein